jgi:hypothetical protein
MSTKERIEKIEIECRSLLSIAPFIASCAAPALAGWRVTIGRIEFVKKLRVYDAELNPMIHSLADEEEAAIVSDWEQFDH